MGYHNAGFRVVGVDIVPRPRYPFPIWIGSALDALRILWKQQYLTFASSSESLTLRLGEFEFVHASPPCPRHSVMTKRWAGRAEQHPELIGPTRELLDPLWMPWVIENVMGAKSSMIDPIMLCGTMFGLQTVEGSQLQRHRLFEASFAISAPGPCQHNDGSAIGVYGGGQHPNRRRPATIGVYGGSGGPSARDNIDHYGVDARREAMGIDWMTGKELSQAIPPAYTEWIGRQAMAVIRYDKPA